MVEHEQFMERVDWNGTKRSKDIQDASIYLLNVTFNDSGTYQCFFNRILFFDNYENISLISKVVRLSVVAKGTMTPECFDEESVGKKTKETVYYSNQLNLNILTYDWRGPLKK